VLVVLAFLKKFSRNSYSYFSNTNFNNRFFSRGLLCRFTINILTLLGLVLSIGLVVDDAIVVLENIYRHMEMGKNRWQAAIDGSNEIGFAVVSTTIALVAVFIPLAFLSGNVGRLFNEFALP